MKQIRMVQARKANPYTSKVVAKQSCHWQGQWPIFDTFLFQISIQAHGFAFTYWNSNLKQNYQGINSCPLKLGRAGEFKSGAFSGGWAF